MSRALPDLVNKYQVAHKLTITLLQIVFMRKENVWL